MTPQHCILQGAPLDCGKVNRGCIMGPDAYRTAGLGAALESLGHSVEDIGNVAPIPFTDTPHPKLHRLAETIAWTHALADVTEASLARGLPITMGGDHALSLGTVLGAMHHAEAENRPLFVLWLDAHTDFHTPQSTDSGNLHGTPLGYVTGRDGFDGFPVVKNPLPHAQIALIGLRSVDAAERDAMQGSDMTYVDMRDIDEHGIAKPLAAFLAKVAAVNGMLHVSLDVDFLDPAAAPAVGTTVPGGATVREAHLLMEMVNDSGLLLDGVTVEPVRADSTCIDAGAAQTAAERLVTTDGVHGIMGADCSGVTGAILQNVARPNGIVMVSPSATSPALSTAEDDGYLVTFTSDMNRNESHCVILDAANPAAGPVAQIRLPERISSGTHATWAPLDDLA